MGEEQLSDLIFGTDLGRRANGMDEAVNGLDAALRGITVVIARELGQSEPASQAVLEWGRVIALPADWPGVQAKRAALLYALWREVDVQKHYADQNPHLVRDLCTRVLPLVMPVFLSNQAQSADALVAMVSVIASMWSEGDLRAAVEEHGQANAQNPPGSEPLEDTKQ